MFRAKTLLVLGAGASAEVGMPVGSQLLNDIVEATNIGYDSFGQRIVRGDYHVSEAIKAALNEGQDVQRYNEHLQAAWQLAASSKQALSIDNVIDALEDERVELVGKLGIVRAIHAAEAASDHFEHSADFPKRLDLSNFAGTWYDSFVKLLCEGVRKSQIDRIFDNLQIINFNYDRCLETYLPESIANYYGLQIEESQAQMAALPMHRPYGIAGKLPWQEGEIPSVEFGGGRVSDTASTAEVIKTFTERVEEGDELNRMRNAVADAERIIFLGFAFHRQNVNLISAPVRANVQIVATGHGVSASDRDVIQEELITAFEMQGDLPHQQVRIASRTCSGLFEDYWRTLTAGAPTP